MVGREVDDGRRGAAGGDDVRLVVVSDERCHLVAVLVQFGKDVRSDEPGCTGQRNFHGETGSCLEIVLMSVASRSTGRVCTDGGRPRRRSAVVSGSG
jgi:hypothetical protein